MPPKIKISKEQMLNAAIDIVRQQGFENLNARELAQKVGSSVQPIFREFNSMSGLKDEVYKAVENIYNQQMMYAISTDSSETGFFKLGKVYIDFAIKEPNLFKLLFMSNIFESKNISEIAGSTDGDDEVLALLCSATGLSKKSAQQLYTGVWITTHGIASLYATNSCNLNLEENQKILSNCYNGLILKLKQDESIQDNISNDITSKGGAS